MTDISFVYKFSENDFPEPEKSIQVLKEFADLLTANLSVVNSKLEVTTPSNGLDGDEDIPAVSKKRVIKALAKPETQRALIAELGIYDATALMNAADEKAVELKLKPTPRILEFRYKRIGSTGPTPACPAKIFNL